MDEETDGTGYGTGYGAGGWDWLMETERSVQVGIEEAGQTVRGVAQSAADVLLGVASEAGQTVRTGERAGAASATALVVSPVVVGGLALAAALLLANSRAGERLIGRIPMPRLG